ncbi:DUF2249 domain-containing protein [Alcaligenaceae bacterium]|nr:DUF2249 domain-containing protein [Alcaligenaceae bacterium]
MRKNTNYTLLDTRGLPPPEPLEHVLEAICVLPPGETLKMLIDREPFPLYDILQSNQMAYSTSMAAESHYEILIWHAN